MLLASQLLPLLVCVSPSQLYVGGCDCDVGNLGHEVRGQQGPCSHLVCFVVFERHVDTMVIKALFPCLVHGRCSGGSSSTRSKDRAG